MKLDGVEPYEINHADFVAEPRDPIEYIVGRLSQASGVLRASRRTQTLSV